MESSQMSILILIYQFPSTRPFFALLVTSARPTAHRADTRSTRWTPSQRTHGKGALRCTRWSDGTLRDDISAPTASPLPRPPPAPPAEKARMIRKRSLQRRRPLPPLPPRLPPPPRRRLHHLLLAAAPAGPRRVASPNPARMEKTVARRKPRLRR